MNFKLLIINQFFNALIFNYKGHMGKEIIRDFEIRNSLEIRN